MDDRRLLRHAMLGGMKDGVSKGHGGGDNEWPTCVERDARALKIQRNWNIEARDTHSWTEMVTEGGRGKKRSPEHAWRRGPQKYLINQEGMRMRCTEA